MSILTMTNSAEFYGNVTFVPSSGNFQDDHLRLRSSTNEKIQYVLDTIVTPLVCVLGFLGNILNLCVLIRIRKRMHKAEGGRDNGTHIGLMTLAVSDMCFCVVVFPRCFLSTPQSLFEERSFLLYYSVYGTGFVTSFILASTWLTVTMAILRYVGICHPFKNNRSVDARKYIKFVYLIMVAVCFLINLPSFWQYQIMEHDIGGHVYFLIDIYFDQVESRRITFLWVKGVFGIFLPAIILIYCNCSLIRALKDSYKFRRQCHVPEIQTTTSYRITLTLVIIIILFVILCFPTEIMDFYILTKGTPKRPELFLTFRSLANVLQVINFSFNCVLYYIVNVHFKTMLREFLIRCYSKVFKKKQDQIEYDRRQSAKTSTSLLTQTLFKPDTRPQKNCHWFSTTKPTTNPLMLTQSNKDFKISPRQGHSRSQSTQITQINGEKRLIPCRIIVI